MQLPKQEHAHAEAYREWLRGLPSETGRSLTAIATELGMAPSTLTRPLKPSDPGTSKPNPRTIDNIVKRYGVKPPPFAMPGSAPRPLRGLNEEATPFVVASGDVLSSAVRALTKEMPAADPWVIRSRTLELVGYIPGDVVIVDLGRHPKPGDAVCAQTNIDFVRGTAETVMRIYERAGSSHVLVAASMDPASRTPIAVDDRVAIKGVVVGMVRPMLGAA